MLPLVADLSGRRVVVIGAGKIGTRKAEQLIEAGALVTLITKEVVGVVPKGLHETYLRPYQHGDLAGAYLVVAATGDNAVNDAIVFESAEANIWLNVVDDQQRSNFFFTAVHRDGEVTVSISTEGASPALAQWIRTRVREALPSNLAEVARRIRVERQAHQRAGGSTEDRSWTDRIEELVVETSDENLR